VSERNPESLVINAWTVVPERREELIDGLLALFKRFQSSEGFVEARVFQGSGGTGVLSYLRMHSAADQRRLDQDPEVQGRLVALREIGRPHRDLYDLVWVFTCPRTAGPVSTSLAAY
jgi:hypothetical protein